MAKCSDLGFNGNGEPRYVLEMSQEEYEMLWKVLYVAKVFADPEKPGTQHLSSVSDALSYLPEAHPNE